LTQKPNQLAFVNHSLAIHEWYLTARTTTFLNSYTDQLMLAGIPLENWGIVLQQSFTASMLLLTATGHF